MFRSLDFIYSPTADVDAAAAHHVGALGAELVFKVRAMGTTVAALRLSRDGPLVLLAGHLRGDRPILVYRGDDYAATLAALTSAGLALHELEIPYGPCAVFDAVDGQRLAVYAIAAASGAQREGAAGPLPRHSHRTRPRHPPNTRSDGQTPWVVLGAWDRR